MHLFHCKNWVINWKILTSFHRVQGYKAPGSTIKRRRNKQHTISLPNGVTRESLPELQILYLGFKLGNLLGFSTAIKPNDSLTCAHESKHYVNHILATWQVRCEDYMHDISVHLHYKKKQGIIAWSLRTCNWKCCHLSHYRESKR